MMTRAELAFSALDKNNKGYITAKDLRKLTKKLSEKELMALMVKVISPYKISYSITLITQTSAQNSSQRGFISCIVMYQLVYDDGDT